MPTNIGAKMGDKEIILKYLKDKSNEDEIIALLQEQKKVLADPKKSSILLNDEYFSLILKFLEKWQNIALPILGISSNLTISLFPYPSSFFFFLNNYS